LLRVCMWSNMDDGASIVDAITLFETKPAERQAKKLKVCVDEESGNSVPLQVSFRDSVRHSFCLRDIEGKTQSAMVARVLRRRFSDDGPAVWWEAREFFYRLGWSAKSDDLSHWLGRKHNVARLDSTLEFYDVALLDHFRRSEKQARAKHLQAEGEELVYDVEIMGSSAWVLAFLLSFLGTKGSKLIKDNAMSQLRNFMNLGAKDLPILQSRGESLPPCPSLKKNSLQCDHINNVVRTLQRKLGQNAWMDAVAFFQETCSQQHKGCKSVATWRYQCFWQIVELIDGHVCAAGDESLQQLSVPVLVGGSRCRRLTATWLDCPSLAVKKGPCGAELRGDLVRKGGGQRRRDGKLMGAYIAHVAEIVGASPQLTISVDCSDKGGKELLTICVYSAKFQEIVWAVPQARSFGHIYGDRVAHT
jgi:hypothetical protein